MTLFEDLTSWENLEQAWRQVRRNVPRYRRARSAGPDGLSLAEFERRMPRSLRRLQQDLREGTYAPQPPAHFSLPKQDGGRRLLARLNVRDRIAQRAALQIIAPLWEEMFLPCSFGYRPGRSTEHALEAVRRLREDNRRWVLHGDVAACFDALDHAILRKRLARRLEDRHIMRLMDAWLEAGAASAAFPSPPTSLPPRLARRSTRAWKAVLSWVSGSAGELADWNLGAEEDALFDPEAERRRRAWQDLSRGLMLLAAEKFRPEAARLARFRNGAPAASFGRRARSKRWLTGGLGMLAAGSLAASWYLARQGRAGRAGVPQGSPLAPLLANVYLHPFDLGMTRAGYALVRFADDWVVCGRSRAEVEAARLKARRLLKALRLEFNAAKTRIISPAEPLPWLGEWVA